MIDDLSLALTVLPPFVLWLAASLGLWALNRFERKGRRQ